MKGNTLELLLYFKDEEFSINNANSKVCSTVISTYWEEFLYEREYYALMRSHLTPAALKLIRKNHVPGTHGKVIRYEKVRVRFLYPEQFC